MDTLAARVSHELEIKQSRFIAHAAPVATAREAQDFFTDAGTMAATHNCWAWRIGGEYRFNDDGEPAGTAGRPILSAIDGQGFDQIAVVVTRWYGGIKLGAGGLVRAYAGVTAECLRTAARLPLVRMGRVEIRYGFEDTGAVHALIAHASVEKTAERFDETGVTLHLCLPQADIDALERSVRDATRDRARLKRLQ